MSKIEEMASIAEYNGTSRKVFEDGFIVGANAILREIEDVLPHLAKNGVIYSIIKDKIKELKGE